MKLLIVTVTRNRKGKAVRTSRMIEGDSFAVGRGTQCAVYLPDPRVALEHATIYRGDGAIRLMAVGTSTLLVDGRPDPEATLAPGSRVEVGPYALTVEAPPAGADLAIAVELLRPLPDDLAEIKSRSRMSLAATWLSKRVPAWTLALLLLLLFLALPIINASMPTLRAMTARLPVTPDQSWNPGPLASGHEGFGHDCSKCHESAFVRVRDRTCLGCHQKVPGHVPTAALEADLFGETRCASCHADHKGDDGLVRADVGLCADCHRDLKRRFPETKLANTSDFAKAHPEFKLTLWRGPGDNDVVRIAQEDKANAVEQSHLKFPHDVHLKQSIRGGKGRVTLTCRSCHAPDASGRGFEPVVMKSHCIDCHTLEFEPAVTTRQVPHGSVEDVMTTMQEFYASIVLNAVPVDRVDTGEIRRAIPNPASGPITDDQRQRALAFAKGKAEKTAQDLFEARVCIVCHEVVRKPVAKGTAGSFTFDVTKVHPAATFLPKSRFDHGKHRTYECKECHESVATSKTSADVSIPPIATCRKCHAGAEPEPNKVDSTCIACHGFHLPGHPAMGTPAVLPVRRS